MPTIYRPQKRGTYKREKETDKRDNINHKAVYNTRYWRNLRLKFLSDNPLCADCLEKGIIKSAIQVHHIISISSQTNIEDKRRVGFDYSNLKGLCKECHTLEHIKNKKHDNTK